MDKHDPLRRTVLRGALAGGCALGIPVLVGCKGEQAAEPSSTPAEPAAPPATSPPPAAEPPDTPATTPQAPDAPATTEPPADSPSSAAQPPDTPATAPGGAKVSQAEAQYQDTPRGEDKCATCQNFIAESNTCAVVEGQVSPEGWCMLWVKKS